MRPKAYGYQHLQMEACIPALNGMHDCPLQIPEARCADRAGHCGTPRRAWRALRAQGAVPPLLLLPHLSD